MNLWERILAWLGGRRKTAPTPTTSSTVTLPSQTTTTIIPTHMLNTITLSTDLTKLYFIDGDQLVDFDLAKGDGVTIGLLNNQLAVVSSHVPDAGESGPVTLPGGLDDERTSVGSGRDRAKSKDIRIALTAGNQYSVIYNSSNRAFGLIGATDIISTITNPDAPGDEPTGTCDLHLFDLRDRNINLKIVDGK
ncbi:MAG: hypothetical protein AAFU67_07300, partial [Bacteroidota bacterium]